MKIRVQLPTSTSEIKRPELCKISLGKRMTSLLMLTIILEREIDRLMMSFALGEAESSLDLEARASRERTRWKEGDDMGCFIRLF